MGNFYSKTKYLRQGSFQPTEKYKTKREITIWRYEGDQDPQPVSLSENCKVKVLDLATKWWQVKYKDDIGFASKHYFRRRGCESFEKNLWYFGAITREDSEDALHLDCNGEGAFLVRCKERLQNEEEDIYQKIFILSVKHYDEETYVPQVKHFEDILNKENKAELADLISELRENIDERIGIKLGNVCMIPHPHSDPGFVHARKDLDNWQVPITELHIGNEIGKGHFGMVFEGTFRSDMSVAVKILSRRDGMDLEQLRRDFLKEKKVMTRLNHPNLVQLYATSIDEEGNDLLIQELVHNGNLLEYLPRIRPLANKEDFEETSFNFVLRWCVQVARGMAQLERLGIVHRDLAARNVLLDQNKRAKVADFGLALSSGKSTGDTDKDTDNLPAKWTAPEALFDQEFTSESDVWSFSILMYEIFSLGEKPYKSDGPHAYQQQMRSDYENKTNEYRCRKPWQLTKATEKEMTDIYNLMKKCWDIEPENRPKFFNLEADLDYFVLTGDLPGYYDEVPFRKARPYSTRRKISRFSHLKG